MLEGMKEAFMNKVRVAMAQKKISLEVVAKALQLSDEAKSLLKNCANWSFNIFQLRDHTDGNELVTLCMHIFAKERIFEELPMTN